MPMRHIALFLAGVAIAIATAATPARAADELTEISTLVQQGKQTTALERIEAFLAANPRDTRGRFLKGVILTGLGKNTEAIRMFSTLTRDFPDLPEPYNNLAVLYALEGDYDRARSTLETAIRKNPGYAIAYENLGDLHAKLASQAYEKARQLDKANTTAPAKIETLRALLKGTPAGARSAGSGAAKLAGAEPAANAKPEPAPAAAPQPAAKTAELSRPAASPPAPAPAAPAPAKSTPATPAPTPVKPAPATPAPAPATPAPAASAPAAPQSADAPASKTTASGEAGEVIAAIESWARAWSAKDATAYLALYAPGFRVPGNAPRAQWEALRRALIDKPRKIDVSISEPRISVGTPGRSTASFRQNYRSDSRDETDAKAMVLIRIDGKWLILEERVVK